MRAKVHHPREPIYKDDDTYLEPDMMYVSMASRTEWVGNARRPILFSKYVSKSGATYDRTKQKRIRPDARVRELWLLIPLTVTIEVRHAAEHKGKPVWEAGLYSLGEVAESRVLSGWRVPVASYLPV